MQVQDLEVHLGGRCVLRDLNLFLNSGELVGLIGPNGAGKTTLLRAILGLVPTSAGEIITSQPVKQLGYVPQRHEFAWDFPITVREAVLAAVTLRLGLMRRPRLEHHLAVESALHRTGMLDLGDRPIGELSGGQKQRVLVARALVLNPDLLLLDEPFTGLDMPTQELLTDLFRTLADDGCAVLMTTHDLIQARATCDRLYLINRTVIASGKPAELASAQIWIDTFNIRENNPLLAALGVNCA
ncbi:MAG: anchored repeat-type ABC transporter ATP-binding subunit [Arcanobacterium sp.]|nr:anchored repeat-type ABC transporter ATP-binding subunit [Arcanobacterium sp.]